MLLPLLVLAALSIAVGLYTTLVGPLLPEAAAPAGEALSEAAHVAPGWLTPSAVGVAVIGILLAWLTYRRRNIDPESLAAAFGPIRTAALRKFWIDDIFVFLYGRVLLGISRAVGWTDRYIVDGVLNVVSAWTLTAGDDLRTLQTGRVQDYVYGIAVGALALILWMKLS
jgi:NADH-quinone oxidoreductase subunit L